MDSERGEEFLKVWLERTRAGQSFDEVLGKDCSVKSNGGGGGVFIRQGIVFSACGFPLLPC